MRKFLRKINRLDLENYIGYNRYFITSCTYKESRYFILKNRELVYKLIGWLKEMSEKENFLVWIYCFMPNHLHLLLEPVIEESFNFSSKDLIKFMQKYKQISGYYFKKEHGKPLWQKSFYDHILRKEEALERVILYILNNPVRDNLVEDYSDYPFSGSFVFNIRDL